MADAVRPLLTREMSVSPCVCARACVRVHAREVAGHLLLAESQVRPGVSRAAWVWVRVCVPGGAAGVHCPSQHPGVGGWAQAVCPGGSLRP